MVSAEELDRVAIVACSPGLTVGSTSAFAPMVTDLSRIADSYNPKE